MFWSVLLVPGHSSSRWKAAVLRTLCCEGLECASRLGRISGRLFRDFLWPRLSIEKAGWARRSSRGGFSYVEVRIDRGDGHGDLHKEGCLLT